MIMEKIWNSSWLPEPIIHVAMTLKARLFKNYFWFEISYGVNDLGMVLYKVLGVFFVPDNSNIATASWQYHIGSCWKMYTCFSHKLKTLLNPCKLYMNDHWMDDYFLLQDGQHVIAKFLTWNIINHLKGN